MQSKIKIAPSILSADFARLGEEVKAITQAGADYIHVDVMDGHFVPNLTIGPCVVKSLRSETSLPFDVHLMIEPVEPYIDAFADAGADIITVHQEAVDDLHAVITQIKNRGIKVGVSIKPATDPDTIKDILKNIDLVLVMSVEPGFGGQSFMPQSLTKLTLLRSWIDELGKEIELEVDGGINPDTAKDVINAGADVLVAGSAVFTGNVDSYSDNIQALRI